MRIESRRQNAEIRKQKTEGLSKKAGGGERTRSRTQGVGFWLWVGLALIVGSAPLSYGGAQRLTAGGSGPSITLRVYNYAQLAPSALERSETVAATVLAQAGVETHWVECPLSPAEVDPYPACRSDLTASDFVIFILPVAMTNKVADHAETLGHSRPCPENAIGCTANLFYARVIGLASSKFSEYQVLGHALAHEIGHLLLGANSHSLLGIMRGAWAPSDFEVMAVSFLTFTASQAERMQRTLRARASTQQTLEAKTVSK